MTSAPNDDDKSAFRGLIRYTPEKEEVPPLRDLDLNPRNSILLMAREGASGDNPWKRAEATGKPGDP